MSDPDRDARRTRATDSHHEEYPVDRYGEYEDWPIERETAAAEDERTDDADLEWIGVLGAGSPMAAPYVYDRRAGTIHEGELDEENERIVIEERGRDVESEDSLGEHIEEIGAEHGWGWLSSFAREYLEGEHEGEIVEMERRDTEFHRRNVPESAPYDLGFFGSHTLADGSGRVHVIERRFDVTEDGDGATVKVREQLMVAKEPDEETRAGDTDVVEERRRQLDVDVDRDDPDWRGALEDRLAEWHAEHDGWPEDV